ncbi:MAG TPA: hypothetical protein VGI96_11680 [Streptosporangiaceae bacterium]
MVVAIKALACELPATEGVPLARWHCPDLALTGSNTRVWTVTCFFP